LIRFGFDIDGTTTTNDWLLPYVNEFFGLEIQMEDVIEYDLCHATNTSPDVFGKWFIENEERMYINPPIMAGAKEMIVKWAVNNEVYFISARGEEVLDVTESWLKINEIPYNHLELIGTHHKIDAIKKHQIQIFFEDRHDNAVNISRECGIPCILFDAPYNRLPIPEDVNVIRCYDWQEAAKWVNEWMKNQL
jgi:uncharacterized HAD superfamily protein